MKRKPLREKPLEAIDGFVDAREPFQRVDVGEDAVEEVLPQPWGLPFVKPKSDLQVVSRLLTDLDDHGRKNFPC